MKPKHKLPPWLRPKDPLEGLHVGVGWYTRTNWEKVKAAATDPDLFEATFEAWQDMAEASLRTMLAAGIVGQKVLVDADSLSAWCLAKGLPNVSSSRSAFVSEQLQRASVARK